MASSSTAPGSVDSPGNPAFQLTREEFEEHEVWQAYNGYLEGNGPQDPNFENFYQLCLRFGYIPSLDTINFVIREASLCDPSRRLQLPVYAFLQEFKFDLHVAEDTDQPRMLVATVHTKEGKVPIWAGWSSAGKSSSTAKMKLYLQPHADEFGSHEADIPEGYRAAFKWEEPFEVLFKLGEYEPTHTNASIQNSILLGVAKVLARFPGLVKPPPGREDTGPWLAMRAAFSDRPFDVRERPSAVSPFWGGFDLLISGTDVWATNHAYHPPGSKGMKRYMLKEAQERAEKKAQKAGQKADKARQKAEEARQEAEDARREAEVARREAEDAS
ncbi:hypothetical protein KCU67_g8843, partial [Aureobasidium melanogenum]